VVAAPVPAVPVLATPPAMQGPDGAAVVAPTGPTCTSAPATPRTAELETTPSTQRASVRHESTVGPSSTPVQPVAPPVAPEPAPPSPAPAPAPPSPPTPPGGSGTKACANGSHHGGSSFSDAILPSTDGTPSAGWSVRIVEMQAANVLTDAEEPGARPD
jgi:hypothetical protein